MLSVHNIMNQKHEKHKFFFKNISLKCQIAEQQQANILLCLMENVKAKYWAFIVETQS